MKNINNAIIGHDVIFGFYYTEQDAIVCFTDFDVFTTEFIQSILFGQMKIR